VNMKFPPKKKGISEQLLKLIAYNPLHGLHKPPKFKKRARGGRLRRAEGGSADDNSDSSPIVVNRPFGELSAGPAPSPTQWLGNKFQDAMEYAGAKPDVARHLREGIGGVLGMSPLGIAGSAVDAVDAKARGDNAGTVQAMAGMLPGVGPEARAAAREASSVLRVPKPPAGTKPVIPLTDWDMIRSSRVEDVPLSKVSSGQTDKDMRWDETNRGVYGKPQIPGYGDKPVAVKMPDGTYHLQDGNHRTALALQRGDEDMPMHVIDHNAYDSGVEVPPPALGTPTFKYAEHYPDSKIVYVDPAKFDDAWQANRNMHVGELGQGKGADVSKYARAKSFFASGPKEFEAPEVSINSKGMPTFVDGRHRFAAMRDMGYDSVPVVMDANAFENASKHGLITKQNRASGGSVQHLADGGIPAFDEARGADAVPAFDEAKGPDKPAESGWTSYLPKAVTDVPHEMYESIAAPVRQVGQTWSDIRSRHEEQAKKDASADGSFLDPSAIMGSLQDVGQTGKALAGVATAPMSLAVAPFRSLIGHPMAQAEHIVGSIINPEAAAKDDPDKMYEAAKGDVDLAMSAGRPRGMTGPKFTPEVPPTNSLVTPEAQANRALASEFDIPLSRGQATQDLDRIRYEDMAARGAYGPEAQERAAKFFNDQFSAIQRAGRGVGENFGHGEQPIASPADAAASINMTVAERAALARQQRDAVVANAEQEANAQRQMVADRERSITESIAGNNPVIEGPRSAGEIVSQNLRDQAGAHRDRTRELYNEFGNLPGEFDVSAVRGMGSRVRQDLTYSDNPVIIDEGTPAAARAIQAMDQMSQPRITNLADPLAPPPPGEVSSVNLRGIDQMRKRLVGYYQQARSSNDASDVRATRAVLNGFDDQIERSISNNLFSGDPRALQALQEARSSFSRYQQLYNPRGAGDDVGTAMRRIIDRNATPEETANLIIGSGKIGTSGLPVRIADRLEEVLGAGSPAFNSIRQAMWQKASRVRNSAGEIDPAKSAASVAEFTNSTLARRMFSPEELRAMRNHAQGVRDLDRLIETMPETQAASQARTGYEEAFGGEDLGGSQKAAFRRMADGTATPEETAQAMFASIGGGNSGNTVRALKAIENIVGRDSPSMGAARQGIWQKLTQNPYGKDAQGQQKMVQGINEFLNGKGREIARQLYTPEERALMNRYAEAVRKTIIPKYARTNSDTAPAMLAAARKYAGAIGSALGMGIHGGATGGLEGYAVGKLLDKAVEKIGAARQAKKLNDTLEDIIPSPRKPAPPPQLRSAAKVLPLSAQGGPTANIGQAIARLQGPTAGRANDEKKKSTRPIN
jgi:hypothetical protein